MRYLLLLSLSLLAFGCSKENKPCPEDGNCGDDLRCEPLTKTCQSVCGKPSDCGKGLNCDERNGVCFSPVDRAKVRECANSAKCFKFGACTPVNGVCRAVTDEDCRQSQFCKLFGQCKVADGGGMCEK